MKILYDIEDIKKLEKKMKRKKKKKKDLYEKLYGKRTLKKSIADILGLSGRLSFPKGYS